MLHEVVPEAVGAALMVADGKKTRIIQSPRRLSFIRYSLLMVVKNVAARARQHILNAGANWCAVNMKLSS